MLKNKHPAELARGLVFQELFTSATNINLNGGVITGALEFYKNGAYFDGTNDYITYAYKGNFSQQVYLSFVIEFTPAFAHNDGVDHFFFDTTAGARSVFYKSAASQLIFNCFGTGVFVLEAAAYSAYWKTNQRNVIVFAGTTGAEKLYLNGVQIGSASTAYTPATNTNFYIGASNAGTLKFAGTMHSFKIFVSNVSALTAQEALDYYTGQTFNYNKRATCILPMTADTHDATGLKTLDVSGKGNHFTFGDGSTASTFPTKLQKKGYSFDGGDSFKRIFTLASGTYSIVAFVSKSTNSTKYLYDFRGAGAGTGYCYWNQPSGLMAISAGSTCYINGKQTNQYSIDLKQVIAVVGGTMEVKDWITIAASAAAGLPLDGNMYYFALYPFALTPLQILDVTLKLRKQLNMT